MNKHINCMLRTQISIACCEHKISILPHGGWTESFFFLQPLTRDTTLIISASTIDAVEGHWMAYFIKCTALSWQCDYVA